MIIGDVNNQKKLSSSFGRVHSSISLSLFSDISSLANWHWRFGVMSSLTSGKPCQQFAWAKNSYWLTTSGVWNQNRKERWWNRPNSSATQPWRLCTPLSHNRERLASLRKYWRGILFYGSNEVRSGCDLTMFEVAMLQTQQAIEPQKCSKNCLFSWSKGEA